MAESNKFRPIYKKWWFWVVLIIVVAGVVGSSNDNGKDKETTVIGKEKEEIKTATEVGGTLTGDGMELTINSVTRSKGGQISTLEDGKEFIVADVTFKNTGDHEISYNSLYFKMQNEQGQIDDAGFTITGLDNELGSGELAVGGTVTGIVAFEQKKGQKEFKIFYEAFLEDKLTFNVSLE